MKKFYLLILSCIFICASSAYAGAPCSSETGYMPQQSGYQSPCQKPCKKHWKKSCGKPCQKPCQSPCKTPCEQSYAPACPSDCFLCTSANKNTLFNAMHLSETQICTAEKIQDKYALEVLSLNERIECEDQNLNNLKRNCAKRSELRKQNRVIKDLKKERRKICKCYEEQFEAIISDQQKKVYKKYKKCK